ncbi:MAG TPA: hypothetical protein PK829_05985 [Promineifilum sp.]|nr:hypothetical protein [Promineifilum sp.]
MKLLGKIVVILMAALMVVGGTLALEKNGALSSLTAGGAGEQGEGAPADFDGAFAPGQRPERGDGDFGGEGGRDGAGSLMSIGRNLGTIAAIVAGVALLGWLARQTSQATNRSKLAKAAMPPDKEVTKPDEFL